MISGISKKVIFFSFLFINFIQPSKSAELSKINKNINNQNTKFLWSNTLSEKILSSNSKSFNNKNSFINLLKKNFDSFLVAKAEKQQELIIQSDKQSEINDVIYAEGNVSVSFRGKLLRADNLIYDKSNKKINATGNIVLVLGDQLFKVSQLEYSFISEKGFLLDVKGSINTNNLIDDLSSNFSLLDSNKIENLLELKKKEVLNTPSKVENWLFYTDKMIIDAANMARETAAKRREDFELRNQEWEDTDEAANDEWQTALGANAFGGPKIKQSKTLPPATMSSQVSPRTAPVAALVGRLLLKQCEMQMWM